MPENLGNLWLDTVRTSPSATALIEGETGRVWTRAELLAAVESWRAALPPGRKLAGHKISLAEPNGPGWLRVFIGLLLEGAIPVPLDPAEPASTRLQTATTIGASWAWENGALQPLVRRPAARRKDLCLVKLTSGSTGTPRALVFTHGQMIADGRQVCASMGIRPSDLNLSIIPFGHSYGLGNLIVPLLVQGTPLLIATSPLPQALAAQCAHWKPTVFPAVPMLLRALTLAEIERDAVASLRLVISAGAPLPPEVAVAFSERFGQRVHSFYGSSETGGICFDKTGQAALTSRSVGTPMQNVQLHFRRGGRFWVESPAVIGRGRFSPPDRAELNTAGELVLLGRAGRTTKIAGRRVDLSEIETLLRALPSVREAFAMPHPTKTDALAAAVASETDAAELRRQLRERTALWKIPDRLLVLPELPRNSRGKIDRARLEQALRGQK